MTFLLVFQCALENILNHSVHAIIYKELVQLFGINFAIGGQIQFLDEYNFVKTILFWDEALIPKPTYTRLVKSFKITVSLFTKILLQHFQVARGDVELKFTLE